MAAKRNGGSTTSLARHDLEVPAPFTAWAGWQLRPRLCEHCDAPIAEHEMRDVGLEWHFMCGDLIIHVRPKR